METHYSSIPNGSTQLVLFKTKLLPHKAMQIKPPADPEPQNLLQNIFNAHLITAKEGLKFKEILR